MKKLLLLCVLAVAVGGCSPSEKSIQKAVAKGDYQYIENYIVNPKYWDNPKQTSTNAAAVEALILLSRIDTAVNLYKGNKGKPKEEMIVKAFINALIKSNPQKLREKLVELIGDDSNDASDALLRKIVTELDPPPSIIKTIVKAYIEHSIDWRNVNDKDMSLNSINKAMAWDIKGEIIATAKSAPNRTPIPA